MGCVMDTCKLRFNSSITEALEHFIHSSSKTVGSRELLSLVRDLNRGSCVTGCKCVNDNCNPPGCDNKPLCGTGDDGPTMNDLDRGDCVTDCTCVNDNCNPPGCDDKPLCGAN